jgi:hypothetical protein
MYCDASSWRLPRIAGVLGIPALGGFQLASASPFGPLCATTDLTRPTALTFSTRAGDAGGSGGHEPKGRQWGKKALAGKRSFGVVWLLPCIDILAPVRVKGAWVAKSIEPNKEHEQVEFRYPCIQ